MEQDSTEAGPSTDSRSAKANRILLLSLQGLPESSLVQLAHSITDGETKSRTEGETLQTTDDGSESFVTSRRYESSIPWRIDNRYYTSEVHFKIASIDLPSNALAIRRPSAKTKGELGRLREEMEDVQVVVAVIQGSPDLSVKDHERFLEYLDQSVMDQEEETMPVGFGLAVSVVVSLPAPVDPSQASAGDRSVPNREEVIELYADHGWEFVDVAASAGLSLVDEDGMTDEAGSDTGSTDEAQGLDRVKEALEANLWPNLVRKDSTRGEKKVPDRPSSETAPVPSLDGRHLSTEQVIDAGVEEEDDEIEAMFRKLDLNLPSMSKAGAPDLDLQQAHAEPTAQDEELARRFLASISDFEQHHAQIGGADDDTPFDLNALLAKSEPQGSHTLPESEEDRKAHQEDALRKLEEFLKTEDVDWPADAVGEGEIAATGKSRPTQPVHSFDDDFDEFVKAPVAQSTKRDEGDDGTEWLSSTKEESEQGESGDKDQS